MRVIDAGSVPRSSGAPTYPGLSFITVSDPGESKLPSQRKAVRSHAALYQKSKSCLGAKAQLQKAQPRKPRRKGNWREESVTLNVDSCPKSRQELALSGELHSQILRSFQGVRLLGAGRVDPFQSYPISWEPFLPELVDHCSYLRLFS